MSAADLDTIIQGCISVSCKWPRDFGTFLSEAEPQDNAPLALFRSMHSDHPVLLEEAATILSQKHPLPTHCFLQLARCECYDAGRFLQQRWAN